MALAREAWRGAASGTAIEETTIMQYPRGIPKESLGTSALLRHCGRWGRALSPWLSVALLLLMSMACVSTADPEQVAVANPPAPSKRETGRARAPSQVQTPRRPGMEVQGAPESPGRVMVGCPSGHDDEQGVPAKPQVEAGVKTAWPRDDGEIATYYGYRCD